MAAMKLSDLTADAVRLNAEIDYIRWLSCRTKAMDAATIADMFCQRWPHALHKDLLQKAAVSAGSTTDANWAGALAPAALADAFLKLARTSSLLGRIPGLRKVPFNVKLPVQSVAGSYYWVAENGLKPATKLGFTAGTALAATKCEGLVIVTRELGELTMPGTETALRDALIQGLTSFTDTSFLSSTLAAVANKNPAGLLNGLTPITTSGNVDTDVAAALAALFTARPGATAAAVITSPATASKLAGTGKNPDARVTGGSVQGVPLVPSEGAGTNIIALDGAGILVADDGLRIATSTEAAVESDDAPVGAAASVIVSLWQANAIGFLVERFVNWLAVPGSVSYVAGA